MNKTKPAENGQTKIINPHNPEYITKRPWYLGNDEGQPSLVHHSKVREDQTLSMKEEDEILQKKYEERIKKIKKLKRQRNEYENNNISDDSGLFTKKIRKGACKNCGALGHKTSECLERPRSKRKSAYKTGQILAPDDDINNQHVDLESFGKLSWDARRDRWQGYDPREYKKTFERYEKLEEMRKLERKKEQEKKEKEEIEKLKKKKKNDSSDDSSDDDSDSNSNSNSDSDSVSDSSSDSSSDDDIDNDKNKDNKDIENNNNNNNNKINNDMDSDDSDFDLNDSDEEDKQKGFVQDDVDQKDFQGRVARQGGVGGAQMKTTVRNLRIREDIPKYLRNLDPNSAFYEPKTRSMRDNPIPNQDPSTLPFAGDNFVRNTGDAQELLKTQLFCWEAEKQGEEINLASNPTLAILAKKKFEEGKQELQEKRENLLKDKYGTQDEFKPNDIRLIQGQSEHYHEYSRDGRIKKKTNIKKTSKYQEDIYINNHLSIWGSYFDREKMKWGYACCHSLDKNSECIH